MPGSALHPSLSQAPPPPTGEGRGSTPGRCAQPSRTLTASVMPPTGLPGGPGTQPAACGRAGAFAGELPSRTAPPLPEDAVSRGHVPSLIPTPRPGRSSFTGSSWDPGQHLVLYLYSGCNPPRPGSRLLVFPVGNTQAPRRARKRRMNALLRCTLGPGVSRTEGPGQPAILTPKLCLRSLGRDVGSGPLGVQ